MRAERSRCRRAAGRQEIGRRVAAATVWLAWAASALPGRALGDGLRRLDAAWAVPAWVERVAVGGATTSQPGGPWLRLGQSRLHGLPELPSRLLAAGLASGGGSWSAEAAWGRVGDGVLADDRLAGRAAAGRRLRWGLDARWRRLQTGPGTVGTRAEVSLDVGWRSRPEKGLLWAVDGRWPLHSWGQDWVGGETETRLRAAVGTSGCAVVLLLDLANDYDPSLGWEALCGLGSGCGLTWRFDGASGAIGGGIVCWRGVARLRTSHLAHPALGLTHRVELSFGRMAAAPW